VVQPALLGCGNGWHKVLQAPIHWQQKHNYLPLEALTRWQRKHNNSPLQHCSCQLHADNSHSCVLQHHLLKKAAAEHGTSKNRAALMLAKGIVARWQLQNSLHHVLGPGIPFPAAAVDNAALALAAGPAAAAAAAAAAPKSSWPWLPCFLQRLVMVVGNAVSAAKVAVIVALVRASLVLVVEMK